jgi:uncharacterized protein YdhG (YjbR/CyaY superfamily)
MKSATAETQRTNFPPGISKPALRALEAAGYSSLEHLTKVTEAELSGLHGMGPKALRVLREALEAEGMSFATASKPRVKKKAPAANVDEFMEKLDHPFKAEVQIIREIIRNVDKGITEQIKWSAPTFSYAGEYLVTFNLWEKQKIHLVFHNPAITRVKSKLLEGDYDRRRMSYFADRDDIHAKQVELENVIRQLVKLIDQ